MYFAPCKNIGQLLPSDPLIPQMGHSEEPGAY